MRDVSIIGIGQVPVGEHWDRSLRDLAVDAVVAALADAQVDRPQMLFVGNMLSGQLSHQENLGALVADYAGLRGVESFKIEAACASGAAAIRMAYLAVSGGMCDLAVACGVEKMTEEMGAATTSALASAAHAEYESAHGVSFVALNALLMRRYMHENGYRREAFGGFAINAHRNAVGNPNAMFRKPITDSQYTGSRMVASPIGILDSSGIGDGAAAVVVAPTAMGAQGSRRRARILASAGATDSVALHDRRDPLVLAAAQLSAARAFGQARVEPGNVDLFEAHDAFTIMSALSLEACGFCGRGEGAAMARDEEISREGRLPMMTMGGLKARGHPVGATGVYQIVEACQQLWGAADANQISNAALAMSQNIGGSGANVITHILERID